MIAGMRGHRRGKRVGTVVVVSLGALFDEEPEEKDDVDERNKYEDDPKPRTVQIVQAADHEQESGYADEQCLYEIEGNQNIDNVFLIDIVGQKETKDDRQDEQ